MDFFNGLCGLLQHIAWTSDSGILRKYLYSRSYKEKDLIAKAKLSKEAKALTPDIKELRSQIKSLDYIRKRSTKYKEYNKQLEQKRNLDKQRA